MKTMPHSLTSLISIWLLFFSQTAGQSDSLTTLTTDEATTNKFSRNQMTMQETTSLSLDVDRLASTTAPVNPATRPSLQTTQTHASPNNAISSMASTTTAPSTAIQSTLVVESRQTSNPTKPPTSELNGSTQSQGTGNTSTFQFSTHPPTRSLPSTNVISTETTSTKTTKDKYPSQVTDSGRVAHTINMDKTALTTQADKRKEPSEKKGTNHGKVVAGIIGGALIIMVVGFLVTYIKKQKLLKQQTTTTDWAGPSPFLEGGGDGAQVTLRSSNHISLSNFLPQRLSKRLSLLPETDEELDDLTPGTTFGGKHQKNSKFCQTADGKESNGTTQADPEKINTVDAAGTVENLEMSSQSSKAHFTKTNSEVSNLNQDNFETPLNLTGAIENAPTQNNEGF